MLNSIENILDTVDSDYGIDPEVDDDTGTVTISETVAPISDDDLEDFLSMIDTGTPFYDMACSSTLFVLQTINFK